MDGFELANSVRYVDDTKLELGKPDPEFLSKYENDLALNSIKISKEITPGIQNSIDSVCKNLSVKPNFVKAYITSSSEIQAGCISNSKENCIITLSSAVVNLLSIEEIKFVIGHELGHFLLNHNIEKIINNNSQESYIKKRAQEISVDRIGLLASKDLNVSIKAIVKSLSGLNENYLTFDMRSFLEQLNEINTSHKDSGKFSSHPSFLLRVKALLRFSLSELYLGHIDGEGGTQMHDIDKLIQKDLDRYVDKDIRDNINKSKEEVCFWGYVFAYIKQGSFTKANQELLSDKFGEQKKVKLIKMIENRSSNSVRNDVKEKLIQSIYKYRDIAPNKAKKDINMIFIKIEDETNQKGFLQEINRYI
tara:strand:+ start:355 stop:1443 length:1089 start_codon:yes stop_codon:yes gene_type:complete